MIAARRWILIVVGLLAGNVVAMVVLFTTAGPADAGRVLPAYYQRAARYEVQLTEQRASDRLGWRTEITLAGDLVEVRLRGTDGAPVRGVQVAVTGYHRAHAEAPIATALIETGPGDYQARIAHARRGWWDLTLRGDRGDAHHVERLAVEAR